MCNRLAIGQYGNNSLKKDDPILKLSILMFLHVHFAKKLQSNWLLPALPHLCLMLQVLKIQEGDSVDSELSSVQDTGGFVSWQLYFLPMKQVFSELIPNYFLNICFCIYLLSQTCII